ncbi:MAG TPA: hypothetical protein PKE65_06970, partial [Rhizobiaceae bacterium]|nr:hypothetical protein [Rhizobiaceae bacterium]
MRKIIYALCSFLVLSAPVATAEESVGELQKKCEAVKSLKGEIRAKAFLDCTIALAERLDFLNGQVAVLSAALPPNAVVAFAGECPATDQGWEPYEPG